MKKLSCRKARQLLDRREDVALTSEETAGLSEHLERCPSCRAYEAENAALRSLLQRNRPRPSEGFAERVADAVLREENTQKIPANRIDPWYCRPVTRTWVTAALVVLVATIPAVALLTLPMGRGTENAEPSATVVESVMGDSEEGERFFVQGIGMNAGLPWDGLMIPDVPADNGASETEGVYPEESAPMEEDALPPAYGEPGADDGSMDLPEKPESGGNYPEEALTDVDINGSVTVSPSDTEGCLPDLQNGRYYVLSGETVTLTFTLTEDGGVLWQGARHDGTSVRFSCNADGHYELFLDGEQISRGTLVGFKDGYLLLSDLDSGGIALSFSLTGDVLLLEVPDHV